MADLPEGRLKRIHVNQHVIRARGPNPLRIKMSDANYPANEITIHGPSKVVYSEKPLSCGARVWIETTARIERE